MINDAYSATDNTISPIQGPKVLLLEDYLDLIGYYSSKLLEAGFNVLVEHDEEQGLKTALAEKPVVIILDISLPESDDFGFILKIRKHPGIASIPVIILTDLSSEEEKKLGMKAGAAEYIVRDDFTFDQVIDKIKEVINKFK